MASIIKISDYRSEAVVLAGRRSRSFTPTRFADGGREEPADPTEGATRGTQLETAAELAERVLAEAEERAAAIAREAMAQGYSEGFSQGMRNAEEQSRLHLERLAELARRAVLDRDAMVRDAQKELAALALTIASRVIRREVAAHPSTIPRMVEALLERVPSGSPVRVLVHPDDVEVLRAKWSELEGAAAFGVHWEVAGDERLERGSCVIETRGGVVDGRIETQLERIASALGVEEWPS